jgi:hypothetical protein
MDSMAIVLLDSIILQNTNEKIRDKSKNIIEELKSRKETESYLSNLMLNKEIIDTNMQLSSTSMVVDSSPIIKSETKKASVEKIPTEKLTNEKPSTEISTKAAIIKPIPFTNDSTEQYYIAFATQKVSAAFVKEMQTAFNYLNNDEFTKQKLNVTYIQFNEYSYIVWIGPFVNNLDAKTYINKIKPRLSTEIISFVPAKQYEIYLLSKSNIQLIKDEADLKQYQQFMFKNIYKP